MSSELRIQPFRIENMEVRSDINLKELEFKSLFVIPLLKYVQGLPSLPKAEDVSYIQIQDGVVSLVMK